MSSRTLPLPPPVSWSSGLVGEHPGQQSQIVLPGGVPMVFCWCPPPRAEDRLGTPKDEAGRDSDDQDLRPVPFTQGFWLAKHPVNQAQWRAVMGSDPSNWKGDDLPVETVSWEDAKAFCAKASLHLPSEAMWEYACRAGSSAPLGIGAGNSLSSQQANFDGGHPYGQGFEWLNRGRTLAQGSFPPNAWGLHDMHGQLWEWCEDIWGGSDRVLRGGSWLYYGWIARSAIRLGAEPRRGAATTTSASAPAPVPSSKAKRAEPERKKSEARDERNDQPREAGKFFFFLKTMAYAFFHPPTDVG